MELHSSNRVKAKDIAKITGYLLHLSEVFLSGKRKLAGYIHRQTGVIVDPYSLFDVQVKRIHQYKRQHLNALQIITQ